MWAFRALAEAHLHASNWFLTLTYAPEFLPPRGELVHRDWQLFAKRLRRSVGKFRYLMCGEYGEQSQRPHFHALLFGLELSDAERFGVRRGFPVYRSAAVERAWRHGLCELGTVTAQSARYCAGYVLKSSVAPERVDDLTGEVVTLRKPYGRMSLKPGLGDGWIRRYYPEVFAHGACYAADKRFAIPERFKRILDQEHPEAFEELQAAMIAKAQASPDNVEARLLAREAVQLRRLSHYQEVRSDAV